MVDDAQTHTLPADATGLDACRGLSRLSRRRGVRRRAAAAVCRPVERHYAAAVRGGADALRGPATSSSPAAEDDPDTLETLARLGFADPPSVAAHGARLASRPLSRDAQPAGARDPDRAGARRCCASSARTANPDAAFVRFDQFLARLPAGVQLFSLFHANPGAARRWSPRSWRRRRASPTSSAQRPALLDAVLTAGLLRRRCPTAPGSPPSSRASLAGARDYEDMLDLARRWASERKFQIGVQLLRRRLDGDARRRGLRRHRRDRARRAAAARSRPNSRGSHGAVPGGAFAVLGAGQARQPRDDASTSDLDLILIYDAPDATSRRPTGRGRCRSPTYYARLSQR